MMNKSLRLSSYFVCAKESIVFRRPPYSLLGTHAWNARLAFEVDQLDPERQRGWSVVARGRGTIVEDDYESEYRFTGHPLPALQGMDPDGRVLYVGTFSKTVFPSLRIGYLIVPYPLAGAFARARAFAAGSASPLEQAVLADGQPGPRRRRRAPCFRWRRTETARGGRGGGEGAGLGRGGE